MQTCSHLEHLRSYSTVCKSDTTSAVTQKIQASPSSSNFRNLHLSSAQITQHPLLSVPFPLYKANLPLFHLFPLQTCCTPDTPAGRRIFHSHPWLREVLLLFTPESIPATTHQVPKLSPHSSMYTAALMLLSHRPSD